MRLSRCLTQVLLFCAARSLVVGISSTIAAPSQAKTDPTTTNPSSVSTVGTTSRIQIVYPPSDIYDDGSQDEVTITVALRALAPGLKGVQIVAGSLRDEASSRQLPTEAFEVVGESPNASNSDISTTSLTRFSIRLKTKWLRPGTYSGTLWIGGIGDSAAQSIPLKVFIRPNYSWFLGFLAIAAGAGLSWFAVFWVVRLRQLSGNQVLVARLQAVVANLIVFLGRTKPSGAPDTPLSLEHLRQISRNRLRELMHDKELSIIAGVTVPPVSSVSVVDEVEGMNRIVRHGFEELFRLWTNAGANQPAYVQLFRDMDLLGECAVPLDGLDSKIQAILAKSPTGTAKALTNGSLPLLASEQSVVHRVIATTYFMDLLSVSTVIVVGMLVLIWKNPGFGTIGDYIEAFLWGLGLKAGADLTKLGPNDIRTSFGIKTPAP